MKVTPLHVVSMGTHCCVEANSGLEHGWFTEQLVRMSGVEIVLETAQTAFGLTQTLDFKLYS